MRAPQGGIGGWLAMKLMSMGNPQSTRVGISRLGLSKKDTFVELGAGHGAGLRFIADELPDDKIPERIVCVEISADFRAELETTINELLPKKVLPVEIHAEDCRHMPYLKDKTVDKMFGMNVVYFLHRLSDYLAEIHRVLIPGGIVVFGCKFGSLPKETEHFVNIEAGPIVEAMEKAGLHVTTEMVEVGPENRMANYTEIKGTKKA